MQQHLFIILCVCVCVRERETISYTFPFLGKIKTCIEVPFPHWTATPKMQGKEDQTNKGVWGEGRHCQTTYFIVEHNWNAVGSRYIAHSWVVVG